MTTTSVLRAVQEYANQIIQREREGKLTEKDIIKVKELAEEFLESTCYYTR